MKKRKFSNLSILIISTVVVMAVLGLSVFMSVMMAKTNDSVISSAKQRLEATSTAVANIASYEELEEFLDKTWYEIISNEETLANYRKIQQKLSNAYDGSDGVEYAYYLYHIDHDTLRKIGYSDEEIAELDPENTGGAMRFVLDNYVIQEWQTWPIEKRKNEPHDDENLSPEDLDESYQIIGDDGLAYLDYMYCVPCEPVPDSVLNKLDDASCSESERLRPVSTNLGDYSEAWEFYLTAYASVPDADGNATHILAGADMLDIHIVEMNRNITLMTVVLIISVVIVSGMCIVSVAIFRKKAIQAQSASEAKSSFLSRMSHEMRTPMNAIVGLCRMAQDADSKEKSDAYLDDISAASAHLRQVIDNVLDLSKIEAGKIKEELTEVEFHRELDGVKQLISTQMQQKNLNFVMDVDENIPERLVCDCTRVRQILFNLLSNAVKFTPENGEIRLKARLLSLEADACRIEWQVTDTGIGMSKETVDKLFQAFEQGDNSTTRKYGGTGLGLAISKQFVELMDGNIWIESEKGKGSTFFFTIRFYLPGIMDAEKVVYETEDFEMPDLSDKHFLLVEDSEVNRLIAVNLFESYGAKVDEAENGLIGYEMYCSNPEKYDIIFMDIQMPVMDGYESAAKIRASGKKTALTVPIVAMTADVFKEDVERTRAVGMNEHLGKPLDLSKVEQAIARVLKL